MRWPCWKRTSKAIAEPSQTQEILQRAHRKEFLEIESVECHSQEHIKEKKASKQPAGSDEKVEKPPKFKYIPCKKGCGYLTDSCQRARNSFSNILSTSKSAAEFRARPRGLVHHVQDRHQWEEQRRCDKHDLTVCKECKLESMEIKTRKCDFHPLTACSCGNCTDRENHECEGAEYHTREVLQCPFHLLVYKIDCLRRIKMADQLVHKTLLRGHSNWLESSHNVFIRF